MAISRLFNIHPFRPLLFALALVQIPSRILLFWIHRNAEICITAREAFAIPERIPLKLDTFGARRKKHVHF